MTLKLIRLYFMQQSNQAVKICDIKIHCAFWRKVCLLQRP